MCLLHMLCSPVKDNKQIFKPREMREDDIETILESPESRHIKFRIVPQCKFINTRYCEKFPIILASENIMLNTNKGNL